MVIRDDAYVVGLNQRRAMFGSAGAEKIVDHTTDINDKIEDFVTRETFGDLWQRPGLSLRDRSKVTFAMLVANGRVHEMRVHARGAIANGVSPVELREIVLHALHYCGVPAGVEGTRALTEVFADLGIGPELDGEAERTRAAVKKKDKDKKSEKKKSKK